MTRSACAARVIFTSDSSPHTIMIDFKAMLRAMVKKGASDLFLSVGTPITLKVSGQCVATNSEPLAENAVIEMLAQSVTPDQIDWLLSTGELNTRIILPDTGYFRLSAMRERGNYAAVIRAIPKSIPAFEQLGLPHALTDMIMGYRGLMLVVGATGAGKSTTVASLLDWRNERNTGHILTVEDPIEYVFQSKRSVINQREVGVDTTSFDIGLRNGLRQSPDVIFIGEIRDAGTMLQAMAYAQTGHFCIATLHAGNSQQALSRIMNFFPVDSHIGVCSEIALTLTGILSQRLVRTVDGNRTPATELMLNTVFMSDLIRQKRLNEITEGIEKSISLGCHTFEEDLARLVREGKIMQQEALRHADSANNLLRRLESKFMSKSLMA